MNTHKRKSRLLLAAVLTTALVSGCGGGGGGSEAPQENISQSVTDLLAFMNRLIAGTDETSEPTDINALTLAVDDTAEPAAL